MRTFLLALSAVFFVSRPFLGVRPKSAMTMLDVYSDAAHWLCGMLFLAAIIPNPPGGKRWPYWVALLALAGVELAAFFVKGGME
jgi:hypothetical protein